MSKKMEVIIINSSIEWSAAVFFTEESHHVYENAESLLQEHVNRTYIID